MSWLAGFWAKQFDRWPADERCVHACPCCPPKVVADLRDECERHGRVVNVKVPRPDDPADAPRLMHSGYYGKVRPLPRWLWHGPQSAAMAARGLSRSSNPLGTRAPAATAQAYVEFADVQGAQHAKDVIHGRLFAGRLVQVTVLAGGGG